MGYPKGHKVVKDEMGRVCINCQEYKLWSMFQKKTSSTTNYTAFCKDCDKIRNRKTGKKCSCGTMIIDDAEQCKECYSKRGGGHVDSAGYVFVYGMQGHPNANKKGQIREHHLVWSEHHGRPVDTKNGETVHHKNGKKDDNRIENLELWVTSQPKGQRPEDLVEWAIDIMNRYASEEDRKKVRI